MVSVYQYSLPTTRTSGTSRLLLVGVLPGTVPCTVVAPLLRNPFHEHVIKRSESREAEECRGTVLLLVLVPVQVPGTAASSSITIPKYQYLVLVPMRIYCSKEYTLGNRYGTSRPTLPYGTTIR